MLTGKTENLDHVTGLDQLKAYRDKISQKWKNLALSDRLNGVMKDDVVQLFESASCYLLVDDLNQPIGSVSIRNCLLEENLFKFLVTVNDTRVWYKKKYKSDSSYFVFVTDKLDVVYLTVADRFDIAMVDDLDKFVKFEIMTVGDFRTVLSSIDWKK